MKVFLLFAVFLCMLQGYSGDIPPGIRNTICFMQGGHCRLFMCRSGERKGDICSDPWNRCCTPSSLEKKINEVGPKS